MVCSILICSHVILCGLADSKYLFSYTHWFRCFMKGNRFSVFEVYSKTVLNKRVRYSCIPVCSLRAGPSRCGAQYETQTRDPLFMTSSYSVNRATTFLIKMLSKEGRLLELIYMCIISFPFLLEGRSSKGNFAMNIRAGNASAKLR